MSSLQDSNGRLLADSETFSTTLHSLLRDDDNIYAKPPIPDYLESPDQRLKYGEGLAHPATKNGLAPVTFETPRVKMDPHITIDIFDVPKGHQQLVMGATGYPYRAKGILRAVSEKEYGPAYESLRDYNIPQEHTRFSDIKARYYVLSKHDMDIIQRGGEDANKHILGIIEGRSHCEVCASVNCEGTSKRTFPGPTTVQPNEDGSDLISIDETTLARFGITPAKQAEVDAKSPNQTKTPIAYEAPVSDNPENELNVS